MSNAQTLAFQQLLDGWRRHQELREAGASIDSLSQSRRSLDEYRYLATASR